MSPSAQRDVAYKYSCRCLNIIINAASPTAEPTNEAEPEYLRVFVGEDGIRITHHYLTLRTRFRAHKTPKSHNTLIQPLALSCLACNTLVYRVAQEIPPDSEAREGPVIPTEDWVEQETLQAKTGWIEVFVGRGGCLVGQSAIEEHLRSAHLSETFSIAVPIPSPAHVSRITPSQPQVIQSPSSTSPTKSTIPAQVLPSLPPLFSPPPFTPSHPVFVALSARAIEKSTELRLRAEEEVKHFIQSQLDSLEQEETRLRSDVENIWQGFREGWKDTLGKVKNEQRMSIADKSERSTSTISSKSGAPMSIRDFSPAFRSDPESRQLNKTVSHIISPSLLSASLVHGGTRPSNSISQAPEQNMSKPEHATHPSTTFLHEENSMRSPSSLSFAIRSDSDSRMPDAFRRNMDTSVDIASSLAWAKGEEEMRRRLGGIESEPTERARKRTSKNLGIGAVEKKANSKFSPPVEGLPIGNSHQNVKLEASRPSPDGAVPSLLTESPNASNGSKKAKRRVTFDVLPDVVAMTLVKPEQPKLTVPEVELFDIDDVSSPEPASYARSLKRGDPEPVTRTPSYKLRSNDSVSRARTSHPASVPASRVVPSLATGASRWANGSLRRSAGLADALPLLGSSVPAGDRVLADRSMLTPEKPSRTPSPPTALFPRPVRSPESRSPSPPSPAFSDSGIVPAGAELQNLLAASAPSHRHAWRQGGRAWEMFHKRPRNKKVNVAITEEHSDDSIILGISESSSDEEDESDGRWRSTSRFASSLPIEIRPPAEYKPSLEPKTSLAEKQGVLVPSLKVTRSHTNSAVAFRRAAYAERDRIRSIDPGPTLDFNEPEENDDEEHFPEIGEGERGRRHALSILQARSVIPEAGMWRSMAS